MSHVSLLREVVAWTADAWRITTDAFAAAGLLPVFAVWGMGLGAVETLALVDERDAPPASAFPNPTESLKA